MVQPGGPSSHCFTSSGLVKALNTRRRGALKARVITISRSPPVVTFRFPVFCIGCAPLPLLACRFFPAGFSFIVLESFEQGVQTLEVGLPNTPVLLQPHLKLLERLGAQGIDAALRVHANVNQSGIAENAQVLGDLRLAETQTMNHVTDRARPVEQEFDDLKSVGLGKSSKCFQ